MEKLLEVVQRVLPSDAAKGKLGSLELNLWLAQCVGLPLTNLKQETHMQKMCIRVFGAFMLFALFGYVYFELYDLYLNWQDLDIMTQNFVLTLTHVVYLFKVLNIFYHYKSLERVVQKLIFLTRLCVITEKQKETFHKAEIRGKLVMFGYFFVALFPSFMAFVVVLIAPEEYAGKTFPYRAEMPDFLPPMAQGLHMAMSVAVLGVGITTIDNLNVLLMSHICMHLKVLSLAFDELYIATNKGLRVEPYNWLVSIVKYHCELIGLHRQVEKIFNLAIMAQFISSGVIIAMTAFQVILGDGSKSSIMMDLMLCCVLSQLFLYCWFGNEVNEQSKTLSTSGFGCSWHQFDRKCKQTLLIFITNAERPFLFTAGGFMGLTLSSFTYIISKSYSIVAVLRQMYSRG